MFARPPLLNLVTIRSSDLEKSETFYTVLGLMFEKHTHGTGPEHLITGAYQNGPMLEIYPLKETEEPTTSTKIGFSIDAVDEYLDDLVKAGGKIIENPHDSEWGRRAVVIDPDGHKVELVTPTNRGEINS